MEKAFIRPLIIRTTSGDDLHYAEEEEGISLTELHPLTGGTYKGLSDTNTSANSRSMNLYVKGPSRGSPDIKYIEEDESESELTALSGIHSRESSTAPAGDCLVEYDVEELNKMLISTPGTSNCSNSIAVHTPYPTKTKADGGQKKSEPVVTIVENNSQQNRIYNKPDKSKSHLDPASEHTYSTVKEDFSPLRLLSRQSSLKSRSSPTGEGGRRLHSSASADYRDEEEVFLEMLRQVVRKCTNADPRKRPSSVDVLEILSSQGDKS